MHWKYRRVTATILICLVFTIGWAHAQEQDFTILEPALCEAAIVEGAAEACIAYAECLVSGVRNSECEAQFTEAMLTLCEGEPCEDDVLFNLALVIVAVDHVLDGYPKSGFQNSLINALANYEVQDNAVVWAVLSRAFEDYRHRLLPYAIGLVQARGALIDQALESYDMTEATQFFTPLVYYSRGYLYQTLEDDTRASRDFYTFQVFQAAHPALAALSVPVVEATDVLPGSETWVLYPLATYGSSPGGETERNLFHRPAREIEIAHRDEDGIMALAGIFEPDVFWDQQIPHVLFFSCTDDMCSRPLGLQETYLGLNAGGALIDLTWESDSAWLTITIYGSESLSETRYIVLFPSAPDPRPPVTCAAGGYSRLQNGDSAFATFGFIQVHEAADEDSTVLFQGRIDSLVTITSDLRCSDDGNWYSARLPDGTTGWVREAVDGAYQLTPDRELPPVESLLTLP